MIAGNLGGGGLNIFFSGPKFLPVARYGVFGVSTWPIGCDTPSPFSERFPFGVQAK